MNQPGRPDVTPEELLEILMPARRIPHGARVAKRTGDQEFVL
jgi:hypothetical protein